MAESPLLTDCHINVCLETPSLRAASLDPFRQHEKKKKIYICKKYQWLFILSDQLPEATLGTAFLLMEGRKQESELCPRFPLKS